MTSLKTPSVVEKTSGSLAAQSALTVIGTLASGPLAALLTVLATTLASGRQRKRVEEAIASIDETLHQHAEVLRDISDPQYKLINEAVLAVLHTTSDAKLAYLRNVVHNAMSLDNVAHHEASMLSRIIRDISAEEAEFIVHNFGYEQVQLVSKPSEHSSRVLQLLIGSPEGLVVPGLISLGILVNAGGTYEDLGTVRFMPITAKLITLLRDDNNRGPRLYSPTIL